MTAIRIRRMPGTGGFCAVTRLRHEPTQNDPPAHRPGGFFCAANHRSGTTFPGFRLQPERPILGGRQRSTAERTGANTPSDGNRHRRPGIDQQPRTRRSTRCRWPCSCTCALRIVDVVADGAGHDRVEFDGAGAERREPDRHGVSARARRASGRAAPGLRVERRTATSRRRAGLGSSAAATVAGLAALRSASPAVGAGDDLLVARDRDRRASRQRGRGAARRPDGQLPA